MSKNGPDFTYEFSDGSKISIQENGDFTFTGLDLPPTDMRSFDFSLPIVPEAQKRVVPQNNAPTLLPFLASLQEAEIKVSSEILKTNKSPEVKKAVTESMDDASKNLAQIKKLAKIIGKDLDKNEQKNKKNKP